MKNTILLFISIFFIQNNYGQKIIIPDSVKASGFYTTLTLPKKLSFTQFNFGENSITYFANSKGPYFFAYNRKATLVVRNTKGRHTLKPKTLEFALDESSTAYLDSFTFYISIVKDSITNTIAYYVKQTNKWKYIGLFITYDTIYPRFLSFSNNKKNGVTTLSKTWLQKEQGGWYAINPIDTIKPIIRPFRNIDSVVQTVIDDKILKDSLQKTATVYNGLYYQILKEGTGTAVAVNDTVTIHYKGWNLVTKEIFDQTKDKPATFPLSRLIPGWQIGVPLCKVGGKIRLYLPSGLAYGIRNVTKGITPNSILVFEIEVLDVK